MEMIGHQTIAKDVAIRQPKRPDFLQKEEVVVAGEINLLPLVAAIIDVVDFIGEELHNFKFCFQKYRILRCGMSFRREIFSQKISLRKLMPHLPSTTSYFCTDES